MALPKDPVMLLSVVNTKLRDEYGSLEDLCRGLGIEEEKLVQILKEIDYEYDETVRQFL